MTDVPNYYETRGARPSAANAARFARQIASTSAPFLPCPVSEARVLDVGCGFGYTSAELADLCGSAVGVEPSAGLLREAEQLATSRTNLLFRQGGIESIQETAAYELVVLDNVLEHIEDQAGAMRTIARALVPGGVAFILVPNKLWPIEVHYHLPFLSWMPIPMANRYLRLTGRGTDYSNSAYAPTIWTIRRLAADAGLEPYLVPPADVALAVGGTSRIYRWGVKAVTRWPALWAVSKALLLIAVKPRR
jgi:2-polyprenyl-3-methyl-5-hydroxy-6-metoxy-1,4-benzoquinol methylase